MTDDSYEESDKEEVRAEAQANVIVLLRRRTDDYAQILDEYLPNSPAKDGILHDLRAIESRIADAVSQHWVSS
jgi:hypothetical protein